MFESMHGIPTRHGSAAAVMPVDAFEELPAVGQKNTIYIVGRNPSITFRWSEEESKYISTTIPIEAVNQLTDELGENKSMAKRNIYVSTADPDNSIGGDGDIWVKIN